MPSHHPEDPARKANEVTHSSKSGSSPDPSSIEGLFLQALQTNDAAEREAFLADACGDDEQQRRVAALLRAYEDAGSFLETPAGVDRPTEEISLDFLEPLEKDGYLGTIGHYEVADVIGRGGMGIVLRASDPKLNRVVAIKVLLPELAANPNARRRFLREAQAAAAVSHPHVVTIHAVEASTEDNAAAQNTTPPYFVMECVLGQSLQEKLDRSGSLRLEEILRISRQIGEGLAAAHQQGLIHRDIKPANILLENGVERVKITDFGLARALDDMTVTRTGEVSGTPQYMSPEQASGERVDHRSDLFSLGCVMYAMCTGHSPFRGDNLAHVIKRVTQDSPRPIVEQNTDAPDWLVEIIDCLLRKDPDQRIQEAQQLVTMLDGHLAQLQQPSAAGTHSQINQQAEAIPSVEQGAQPTSKATKAPVPMGRLKKIGRGLLWLGALAVFVGFATMLLLLSYPLIFSRFPLIDENSHVICIATLGAGLMLLIAGTILRGSHRSTSFSLLAFYILLGPLGIVLWLIDRDSRERAAARANHRKANGPAADR